MFKPKRKRSHIKKEDKISSYTNNPNLVVKDDLFAKEPLLIGLIIPGVRERERETETETDRQTDRQTDRDRDRETETERDTDTDTDREGDSLSG